MRLQNNAWMATWGYLLEFRQSGADAVQAVRGQLGELGGTYNIGALAAGTQLELTAVGGRISFLVNGVQYLSAADTSLTGGAPGMIQHHVFKGWVASVML